MNTAQSVCGTCLRDPPAWQRLYCVGSYQQPLSGYIHQFKYEGQFLQADKLATLLSPLIESPAEVVTSVPLHWQRYMKRGFNQSELLAVSLAKQLERPYVPMFQRVQATQQQQGLSRQQRQVNLANAFKLKSVKNYQHVAIVDDVVTTGSTVHHLCKLLLDAGVKSVDIYCICRTPDSGT
ncbi:phosphoribosyltransferase family protein [Vibrio aquaticus]